MAVKVLEKHIAMHPSAFGAYALLYSRQHPDTRGLLLT